MAFLTYQSEDGTVEETVRCTLSKRPKYLVRDGVRLYPMLCGQKSGEIRMVSESNGIIGTMDTLRAAQAKDARLGVPVKYKMIRKARGPDGSPRYAWVAEWRGSPGTVRADKNRWLRAHNRNDLDAGYSDPAPGFTRGKFPKEFE